MREIKFRAWDNVNKIMLDDVTTGTITICDKGNKSYSKDCIFMQYTGLQDRTDRDIFEGDIARIEDYYENVRIGIIAFDSGTYKLQNTRQSFYYEFGSDAEYDWESIENVDEDNIEILGNIYENPELLNIK